MACRPLLPLLAVVAAFAACAAGEPSGESAPQEPAASGEAPLTAEGWGPLRIGMTTAQVVEAMGPDSDPEAIGGPEPEFCDMWRPARAPEGLLVMIEDGRLTSIWLIETAPIRTDRGFSVGARAADVQAAYGPALESTPHHYSGPEARYLTIWARGGGQSEYVEDPDARGMRYETDPNGRVESIAAGGPSIQYVEGCA